MPSSDLAKIVCNSNNEEKIHNKDIVNHYRLNPVVGGGLYGLLVSHHNIMVCPWNRLTPWSRFTTWGRFTPWNRLTP